MTRQRSLVNQTRAARFGGAFAFLPSHHSPRKTPAGFISSPPGGERWEAMAGWGPSRLPTCGPWGRGVALERELSRDGSHYSISSGILPSLGARSNRRVKLRPFIVSPYDRRYRFFFFFRGVLLVISSRSVLLACVVLPTVDLCGLDWKVAPCCCIAGLMLLPHRWLALPALILVMVGDELVVL